jgi:hypothetical protein
MSPELIVQFIALLATVGVGAFTIIKVARVFAHRSRSVPDDVVGRLEELERALRMSNRSWQKPRSGWILLSACLARCEKSAGLAVEREPRVCAA